MLDYKLTTIGLSTTETPDLFSSHVAVRNYTVNSSFN